MEWVKVDNHAIPLSGTVLLGLWVYDRNHDTMPPHFECFASCFDGSDFVYQDSGDPLPWSPSDFEYWKLIDFPIITKPKD